VKYPQDEEKFQYRKRYGLHAIRMGPLRWRGTTRFNTASGMDCMQYWHLGTISSFLMSFNTASGMDCMQWNYHGKYHTSFSRFNTASGMDCMQCPDVVAPGRMVTLFQYRKRYGLHAIGE